MVRLWLKRTALFLLIYFIFLLARLPADHLYGWVEASLPPSVPLAVAGVDGTVWSGSARQLQFQGRDLGTLHWSVTPLSLLGGAVGAELSLQNGDGYLKGDIDLSLLGNLTLSDAEGRMPVGWFTDFIPFMPVVVDGLVSVDVEQLTVVDGKPAEAAGKVIWHQAAMSVPQPLDFGDMVVELGEGDGGGIAGTIRDRQGALSVDLNFSLVDGSYSVEGSVAPASGAPRSMAASLSMLGRAGADGRIPLKLSGKL